MWKKMCKKNFWSPHLYHWFTKILALHRNNVIYVKVPRSHIFHQNLYKLTTNPETLSPLALKLKIKLICYITSY